jgi:polyhydroxyalkanoate synthesis regulator phasin
MTEDRKDRRSNVGEDVREGIRAGLGILSALKDAIEETVQDMLDRGELSQERAREAVRTTMDRAQDAFEDARSRFDFVLRAELEQALDDVRELRRRVERLEARAHEHDAGPGPETPASEG